jgi:transcriptional regulator with XRE-family HTH domain
MSALAEKVEKVYPNNGKRNKYDLDLNKRLKVVREKRGLTFRKVVDLLKARGVKTGASTIQGYEADENAANHRYPSPYMLLHLSKVYNCSLDYVFGLSEEIERQTLDIKEQLLLYDVSLWGGQEITAGEKALLLEKGQEIISL